MKIITNLPDWSIHFEAIATDNKWKYVWQHKGSYYLRVCSQNPSPWGTDCVLRIKEVKNKTPAVKYTNRLDLQILDIDDTEHAVPGAIIMETPFIGIPHSTQPTLRFYAIPCTKNQDISLTIMISIVAI